MSDEKIEVVEVMREGDTFPSLSEEQLMALHKQVWDTLRVNAGTKDVARVAGMILADVLLQMYGSPALAYLIGVDLMQQIMREVAGGECVCGQCDIEEEKEDEPESPS